MAYRISLRGRGRERGSYYPLEPQEKSAAECAENGAIGPMTREQAVAFLWRVKSLSATGSVTWTTLVPPDFEDPESVETEESRTSNFNGEPSLRAFEGPSEGIPDVPWVTLEFDDVGERRILVKEANALNAPFGLGDGNAGASVVGLFLLAPERVSIDPSGGVWIVNDFRAIGSFDVSGSATVQAFVDGTTEETYELEIECDFEFLGSTFSFPMRAVVSDFALISVDSATCSFAVAEWAPYQTSTGAAAWNATTGGPANGGPGA